MSSWYPRRTTYTFLDLFSFRCFLHMQPGKEAQSELQHVLNRWMNGICWWGRGKSISNALLHNRTYLYALSSCLLILMSSEKNKTLHMWSKPGKKTFNISAAVKQMTLGLQNDVVIICCPCSCNPTTIHSTFPLNIPVLQYIKIKIIFQNNVLYDSFWEYWQQPE